MSGFRSRGRGIPGIPGRRGGRGGPGGRLPGSSMYDTAITELNRYKFDPDSKNIIAKVSEIHGRAGDCPGKPDLNNFLTALPRGSPGDRSAAVGAAITFIKQLRTICGGSASRDGRQSSVDVSLIDVESLYKRLNRQLTEYIRRLAAIEPGIKAHPDAIAPPDASDPLATERAKKLSERYRRLNLDIETLKSDVNVIVSAVQQERTSDSSAIGTRDVTPFLGTYYRSLLAILASLTGGIGGVGGDIRGDLFPSTRELDERSARLAKDITARLVALEFDLREEMERKEVVVAKKGQILLVNFITTMDIQGDTKLKEYVTSTKPLYYFHMNPAPPNYIAGDKVIHNSKLATITGVTHPTYTITYDYRSTAPGLAVPITELRPIVPLYEIGDKVIYKTKLATITKNTNRAIAAPFQATAFYMITYDDKTVAPTAAIPEADLVPAEETAPAGVYKKYKDLDTYEKIEAVNGVAFIQIVKEYKGLKDSEFMTADEKFVFDNDVCKYLFRLPDGTNSFSYEDAVQKNPDFKKQVMFLAVIHQMQFIGTLMKYQATPLDASSDKTVPGTKAEGEQVAEDAKIAAERAKATAEDAKATAETVKNTAETKKTVAEDAIKRLPPPSNIKSRAESKIETNINTKENILKQLESDKNAKQKEIDTKKDQIARLTQDRDAAIQKGDMNNIRRLLIQINTETGLLTGLLGELPAIDAGITINNILIADLIDQANINNFIIGRIKQLDFAKRQLATAEANLARTTAELKTASNEFDRINKIYEEIEGSRTTAEKDKLYDVPSFRGTTTPGSAGTNATRKMEQLRTMFINKYKYTRDFQLSIDGKRVLGDTIPPITNIHATSIKQTEITVAWEGGDDDELYTVSCTGSATPIIVKGNNRTATFTGLTPATDRTITIEDSKKVSVSSSPIGTFAATITGVNVERVTQTEITLIWEGGIDADNYTYTVTSTSPPPPPPPPPQTLLGNVRTVTFTGLTANTTYTIAITHAGTLEGTITVKTIPASISSYTSSAMGKIDTWIKTLYKSEQDPNYSIQTFTAIQAQLETGSILPPLGVSSAAAKVAPGTMGAIPNEQARMSGMDKLMEMVEKEATDYTMQLAELIIKLGINFLQVYQPSLLTESKKKSFNVADIDGMLLMAMKSLQTSKKGYELEQVKEKYAKIHDKILEYERTKPL